MLDTQGCDWIASGIRMHLVQVFSQVPRRAVRLKHVLQDVFSLIAGHDVEGESKTIRKCSRLTSTPGGTKRQRPPRQSRPHRAELGLCGRGRWLVELWSKHSLGRSERSPLARSFEEEVMSADVRLCSVDDLHEDQTVA